MKLIRFLAVLLLIVGLTIFALFLTGNQHLTKGVWATYLHGHTTATIDDDQYFDTREVTAGKEQEWVLAQDYNQRGLSDTLEATLEKSETVAFLVVKNDEILVEKYWNGYDQNSFSNSFSMAKSITTMLAQIAIQKGYIKSWEDPLITYLPNLQGPFNKDLQLKDLSMMTAGLKWDEGYKAPFGITAKAYYGPDIETLLYEQVPIVNPPGKNFQYQSGASQLLGLAIAKATGKSISQFASEELWQPIGASQNAYWHLDSEEGTELTYCCFNSNIRDFARFGKLLENHGRWNGQSILDSTFISKATSPGAVNYYGWSFWIDSDQLTKVFYMRGILGQYIVVIPEKNLVICRLGKKWLAKTGAHTKDLKVIVQESLKYFGS